MTPEQELVALQARVAALETCLDTNKTSTKSQFEINADLSARVVVYRSILISLCTITFGIGGAKAVDAFRTSLDDFKARALRDDPEMAKIVNPVVDDFWQGFNRHYNETVLKVGQSD